MRARVSELLAEYQIPSATIGILYDGAISEFAVGVTDVTTREPATTDTIYQCGSMTKTWTALAFMQLVDEGKVDLEEPVRTLLPGFRVADPDVSAKVTARHLLNHTNGIEEDFGDPGEDTDVYERMFENIADARQVHPLGDTHGYSAALGYAILARIMEVIDDKRWDDIMTDRLFGPLGLTDTSSWREQVDQDRAAKGHVIRSMEEGPIASPVDCLPRSFGPGGNVNSTVRDVLTMAQVLLNGGVAPNGTRILSAELVHEMMTSRVPLTPDPALNLDLAGYEGVYTRPGTRFELEAVDGNLFLTHTLNPMHAEFLGKPERIRYELLPVSDTHFLMPSDDPLEHTQTVAIYDNAQYLHTNCRVHPRSRG